MASKWKTCDFKIIGKNRCRLIKDGTITKPVRCKCCAYHTTKVQDELGGN